ncbi:hypothetical protein HS088_TW16G00379 [Tripterygium wilfordii]|uniref:Uncharacterized protein n=1 Tax=Tripterygium wilfordii TaxID=458696 RepID=A0A7J7CIP7_TRIWF|nr:uncharacterized protein LOC119981325 [Tripterygium wilfordii]KAF5733938.1 hypothetical protein HS088_TW16G00379 [Tripterygium wilfordii]
MAHSMISPPTTVTTPITTTRSKHQHQPPSLGLLRVSASSCHGSTKTQDDKFINRRSVTLSLAAGVVVVGLSGRSEAAGRRPPPPPAEEKKDPNVSGVQAKVLASKKRKEAMKESVAKLREKGKSINN